MKIMKIFINLAGSKKEVFEFFDNVKVNEENEIIKKKQTGTYKYVM